MRLGSCARGSKERFFDAEMPVYRELLSIVRFFWVRPLEQMAGTPAFRKPIRLGLKRFTFAQLQPAPECKRFTFHLMAPPSSVISIYHEAIQTPLFFGQ